MSRIFSQHPHVKLNRTHGGDMKHLLLTATLLTTLFSSVNAFAVLDKEPCRTQKNMRLKINAINANIANAVTTRTPEGGPYQRQELICKAQYCVVISRGDFIERHLPGHPDANEEGNVRFPNINVREEQLSLTETKQAYNLAARNCTQEKLARQ